MRNRARKSLQGLMFAALAVMSLQLSAAGPSDEACSAMPANTEPDTETDAFNGDKDDCGSNENLDELVGLSPAHCAALLEAQAQGATIPAEFAEDVGDYCKEWPLWTTTDGAVAYPADEANWSPVLWTSNILKPQGMHAAGKKTGRGASRAASYLANRFGGRIMGRMSSFNSWLGRGPARKVVRNAGAGVGKVGTKALSLGTTAKNQARTVINQTKDKVSAHKASFRKMAEQCKTGGGCQGMRKALTRLDRFDRVLRAGFKAPGKAKEKVIYQAGRKVKYWISAACNASKECTTAHKRAIVKFAPMFVKDALTPMAGVPAYDPYFGTGQTLPLGGTEPIPIAGTDVDLTLFVDKMW